MDTDDYMDKNTTTENFDKQSLTEHLRDLRSCLIVSLVAVAAGFGVAYAYIDDYRRNRPDAFKSAVSLDKLANKLSISAAALNATVDAYNTKSKKPLGHGPYVALGPVRAMFVHAEGGLAVDHDQRVLGESDRLIPGLYAAGSTGQGGLLLKGHGHHLGWAFSSGRRAGRNAATF